MIHLYTWKTPNGRKVPIALEELGLAYTVYPIDIGCRQQFSPDFLRISPNNKIPAIVDENARGGPMPLFESGAILTYLAEKTGRLLPSSGQARYRTLQWLHWHVGGVAPAVAQLVHFALRADDKSPAAIERFRDETNRLLEVLERRLGDEPYLAGADYSIADIANYPWIVAATTVVADVLPDPLSERPSISRWMELMRARPAVARGMRVPET